MARIPSGGVHLPVDSQTVDPAVPAPATPSATDAPTSSALSEDQLRAAAASIGLDPETMSDADRDFFAVVHSGQLASLPPSDDPENPAAVLIPTDDTPPVPTVPVPDGATTDDAGVGVGTEPSSEDGGAPSPDVAVPSLTTSAIPSAFAPPAPATPTADDTSPALTPEQLQALLNRYVTPEEQALINLRRQGLADVTFVDPATGRAVAPGVTPPAPGAPQPTSLEQEWIDPAAQSAVAALTQQVQSLQRSQQEVLAQTVQAQQTGLVNAIGRGVAAFSEARGLTEVEAQDLLTSLDRVGILPQFGVQFPGDPSSAVQAALDAVYWATPTYRDREFQREYAKLAEANRTVEDKKALAGGIVSSPGSVPRATPAPKTRDERDRGMVDAIAASMRGDSTS